MAIEKDDVVSRSIISEYGKGIIVKSKATHPRDDLEVAESEDRVYETAPDYIKSSDLMFSCWALGYASGLVYRTGSPEGKTFDPDILEEMRKAFVKNGPDGAKEVWEKTGLNYP